jgi:hypothetical protein
MSSNCRTAGTSGEKLMQLHHFLAIRNLNVLRLILLPQNCIKLKNGQVVLAAPFYEIIIKIPILKHQIHLI